MQLTQQLLKIALLGTERQTQVPSANADLQPYLQSLYPQGNISQGEAREAALLSAYVLAKQYQRVGFNAPHITDLVKQELPTDIAPDAAQDLPLIPVAAEPYLARLLLDNQLRPVLTEWLEHIAHCQWRVPEAFIVALLNLAQHHSEYQHLVIKTIGLRGHWLAKQKAEWAKLLTLASVGEASEHIWEEGNVTQRSEYLRELRRIEPAKARDLLKSVWKQEAAAVRQTLLDTFSVGLSAEDEAWLESCLDDRAKDVRQLAAALLGALPESAFSQRHQARLTAWLDWQVDGLLSKLTGSKTLQVDVDTHWEKSWQRDGIEEKPPQDHKGGLKAWYLQQALGFVPPRFWTKRWLLSPSDLLDKIKRHEWKDALLQGWQQALIRYPDQAWIQAWLLQQSAPSEELWRHLTPEQQDTIALTLLKEKAKGIDTARVLTYVDHPWTDSFSRTILSQLAEWVDHKQTAVYRLYDVFRFVALHSHPASLTYFEQLFAKPIQDSSYNFHMLLNGTLSTLRLRADMLAALQPCTKD